LYSTYKAPPTNVPCLCVEDWSMQAAGHSIHERQPAVEAATGARLSQGATRPGRLRKQVPPGCRLVMPPSFEEWWRGI